MNKKTYKLFGAENPTCVSFSFELSCFYRLLGSSDMLVECCFKLVANRFCRGFLFKMFSARFCRISVFSRWLWLGCGAVRSIRSGCGLSLAQFRLFKMVLAQALRIAVLDVA